MDQELAERLAATGAVVVEGPKACGKTTTARLVHMRVRAVMEWAIAMDRRTDNPCDRLLHLLGPQHDVVKHHQALPHGEVAAAIEKARAADPGRWTRWRSSSSS